MTAPDTTGGELREAIARAIGEAWITSGPRAWDEQSEGRRVGARHLADAVLALPALRDLLAERDKLAALADDLEVAYKGTDCDPGALMAADLIRRALGTPTTGGGQ